MKKAMILTCAVAVSCVWGATVTVVAPQAGAAKSVTVGTGTSATYSAGATAPLKAAANDGWSFAGWYEAYDEATGEFSNEAALAQSVDWRTPSANYVVGDADVTLYARFVKPKDDSIMFDLTEAFANVAYDVDSAERPLLSLTNAVDEAVSFESFSLPVVTISGLPSGLSFNGKTMRLSGTPKVSGVHRIVASAKNSSGYSFSQILYVRVENMSSPYVIGYDVDADTVCVGDEVDSYISDYFEMYKEGVDVKSVSVAGLPAGLSLELDPDFEEYTVRGIPTKAGDYLVVCTVTFTDNTVWSANMLFTVSDPLVFEGNVDFTLLDGHSAGDVILAEDGLVIGEYNGDAKTGVTSVSGLPTGITAVNTPNGYGGSSYVLKGVFSKAGEYTVSVKVAYENWEDDSLATVTLTRKVIVGDRPGIYITAEVFEPENAPGCKVSGGGVYASGAIAKLTATAGKDYVFAGWCDSAGLPRLVGTDDYRKPQASVTIVDGGDLEWTGAFIPKADDMVDVSSLDGAELEVDPTGYDVASCQFTVYSGSLPTITFKNLPAGMACAPSTAMPGDYVVFYDPVTATKKPSPGRYTVTATAANVSRMTSSANFMVTVLNYTDPDIHVEDDYGILTPNVAMTPISLSNAVDFARGDTLTVTGLPTGLKYNDKTAPLMIAGTPTKPGDYTLTFTGKIVESAVTNETTKRVTYTYRTGVATAFIKVKDFPRVEPVISGDALTAGNKVSGGGNYKAGTKVTLKATAAKDWTFAGWSGVDGLAALNPSLAYVVGTDDLTEINAEFIHKRDDVLFVDDPGVVAVAKGVAFSTNLVEQLIETRSLPTVSVSGLPSGLKFDTKTFLITGTVGKSTKAGYAYATVSAKNASGYTYVRVVKFVVLENASDEIPEEPVAANGANIDFSDLDGMTTGGYYPAEGVEAIGFGVDPSESGADVTAVSVSGLPSGMKSVVFVEDGYGEVVVYGTPNKPGRCTVKVQVTYSDRKKVASEYAFIVEDGGSGWLDVESFDAAMGTVSGAGVYASGASVKLGAKPAAGNVFAGWFEDDGMPFDVIATTDGVDYRTAAASFLFRKDMFTSVKPILYGGFVAKADDTIAITLDELWEIDPAVNGELPFAVESASLPKLTVSGLPKGVVLDAAQGKLVYSAASQAQIVPGWYTVTLKATNQSNASATARLSVFVANKTTDVIGGLDPAADAYSLFAGMTLDPELILPEVDSSNGWKLAVAGLPSGLKLVQDKVSGAYSVTGVPAKAATNTVTFTATKGKEKEVATITVTVAALPAWANGTYDGAYYTVVDGVTNASGSVNLTVSAVGKVSGKILTGGKSYSFSAPALDGYEAGAFTVPVTVPWTAANKEEFLLTVGSDENGVGYVTLEPTGEGTSFGEAVQNVWLRKDMSAPAFATGAKQPTLALDSGVVCKFGAKGAVTLAGKIGDVSVSGKAQLLLLGDGTSGRLVIYLANAKFAGGAYCEVVDVVLADMDGDGLIDSVSELDM